MKDITRIKRASKRIAIAIIGGIVLVIGLIAIPYPGPGWLIVFAGLGILATEFVWASRLLAFARTKYEEWEAWLRTRSVLTRFVFLFVTALVVVMTIYLLNGYGILMDLLGLDIDWLRSPLLGA